MCNGMIERKNVRKSVKGFSSKSLLVRTFRGVLSFVCYFFDKQWYQFHFQREVCERLSSDLQMTLIKKGE